jgi:hypothetical protein
MTIRTILAALVLVAFVAACATIEPPAAQTATLTVVKAGDGSGTVTSSPAGITNTSPSATFERDEVVTLTATADAGSEFVGFTGYACEGTTADNVCVITMDASRTVTATFAAETGEGTLVTVTANLRNTAEEFLTPSSSDATLYPAGWTYSDSSDLELGYDPSHGPQAIGLRFADVQIPAGATIVSAVLRFTSWSSNTGTGNVSLGIAGQSSTSSVAFPQRDPEGAPTAGVTTPSSTTAEVPWQITQAWAGSTVYETPDLTSIVQEIIGLGGWTSGTSDIVLVLEPDDMTSTAYRRALPTVTLAIRYTTP